MISSWTFFGVYSYLKTKKNPTLNKHCLSQATYCLYNLLHQQNYVLKKGVLEGFDINHPPIQLAIQSQSWDSGGHYVTSVQGLPNQTCSIPTPYIFRKSLPYFTENVIVEFSRSVMSNSTTPWTAARQGPMSISNSWSPPKPMSIESVMSSNYLILCCPLFLLPSILPSTRVFSDESVLLIGWPKY